jgi:hypothetical protein
LSSSWKFDLFRWQTLCEWPLRHTKSKESKIRKLGQVELSWIAKFIKIV